jgi:hypothetical protein
MLSPFPGMDPFLESPEIWPKFHNELIGCLHQALLPALVDRYRPRIRERRYTIEPCAGDTVVKDQCEEYIEIRERQEDRIVTLLYVVSPANKTIATARDAYLATRREGKNAGANLVEIDVVLQGKPTLDYSREGLPDWDYAVTVKRNSQPDRYKIYKAALGEGLPRFRLPVATDDRDVVVDLQSAFALCFERGGFGGRIDYQHDPIWATEDQRRRIRELLNRSGR